MPTTPSHFFETWLPERFRLLLDHKPELARTSCSLLVKVGDYEVWLATRDGALRAERFSGELVPTFRLQMNLPTFDALLAPATEQTLPLDPLEKILGLDQEALDLIANVPGSLRLELNATDTTYVVTLGPGHHAADNIGCTIACELDDLINVQKGAVQPIELLMGGKIAMDGDVQIAMALGGLLM